MKRRRRPSGVRRRIILLLAAICAVLALAYQGGRWLEKRNEQPETRGDHLLRYTYEDSIEVDGESYMKRRGLTTILLIGVDEDVTAETGGYRSGGQADFLRLLVIDSQQKKVSQLQIDRDTMTPITILGVLGNRSGVRTAQIALSHDFGQTAEQNCQMTVEAVSNLLLGIDIDYYAAMSMDGIPVLNDAVGGVTITVGDDLTAIDPAMTPGAMLKLTGAQAESFVRARKSVGSGTNEERMGRQQTFLTALGEEIVRQQGEDEDFVGRMYDALSPYVTTNLTKARLVNEAWFASEYDRAPAMALTGVHKTGSTGYMEFIVDEDSIEDTVLALFYEKIS